MIKLGYVSHCPGHRNSEGESAPWCIRQHNTDKILESFKSEEAAKEGLRNMESHKGSVTPRSEYPAYARELIAMFGKDPEDIPTDWQSPAQDYAAATGIDADYLYDAVLKELERRQPGAPRFTASLLQRKARSIQVEGSPMEGAVAPELITKLEAVQTLLKEIQKKAKELVPTLPSLRAQEFLERNITDRSSNISQMTSEYGSLSIKFLV